MKRKICVVTGTRAEYGLLTPLMQGIQDDPTLDLLVAVTGMHLAPEFGLTYRDIETDGFPIHAKIDTLLSSDTPVGVSKSLGLGVLGFADTFDRLSPDIVVLLGDRFEILAAAQAALIQKTPVAHIAGGDVTQGAVDDSIRHCITKMAQFHFVTHDQARRRVIQLGEPPEHVHRVGSLSIDRIAQLPSLTREELAAGLGLEFKDKNLLVTYHPTTLAEEGADQEIWELLAALDDLPATTGITFTAANADAGGRLVNRRVEEFVARRPGSAFRSSLGQQRYFSLIRESDAVVGNSSSGLYEVPSFGKPTVDIGMRQHGRIQASSVINCRCEKNEIGHAIEAALCTDCSNTVNPYGDGHATERILKTLREIEDPRRYLTKRFHDLSSEE